jgi:hypothetical protein
MVLLILDDRVYTTVAGDQASTRNNKKGRCSDYSGLVVSVGLPAAMILIAAMTMIVVTAAIRPTVVEMLRRWRSVVAGRRGDRHIGHRLIPRAVIDVPRRTMMMVITRFGDDGRQDSTDSGAGKHGHNHAPVAGCGGSSTDQATGQKQGFGHLRKHGVSSGGLNGSPWTYSTPVRCKRRSGLGKGWVKARVAFRLETPVQTGKCANCRLF